jgi:hypothetical protein
VINRRGLFWLLAFALVGAQALGLMHRIVHGPQVAIGHEFAAQHEQRGREGGHDHDNAHGWLGVLFSGHDDDSTCRLFDPLGHDAAPAVAAVAMPVILSSFFLQWFQGEALVRWAALFDARGPPSLR